jgi:hypothetical protein
MQFRINRHDTEAGSPSGEEQLEIDGRVFKVDGDAVARLKLQAFTKSAR